MFSVLERILPNARFYFYRLRATRREDPGKQNENGSEFGNRRIREALAQALDDDIDVLNMSVGRLHLFCNNCVFDRPITEVHRQGTNVAAAIGNKRRFSQEHVLCPALTQEAISVGGSTTQCKEQVASKEVDQRIWANTESLEDVPREQQGPYCSFRGCSESRQCTNREEEPLDLNIRSYKSNPEILAPGQIPHQPIVADTGETMATFAEGTSFATPIVAGVAARLQSAFSPPPSPDTIRDAILESSSYITGNNGKTYARLNVAQTVKQIN